MSPDSPLPVALPRVAERPRLFVHPHFLDAETCSRLAALARDDEQLTAKGVTVRHDATGSSAELPLSLDPGLLELARRVAEHLGLVNEVSYTFRMRRYREGDGHPAHIDTYTISGFHLTATAIICVAAPERGGQTAFLATPEGPLAVEHAVGQLVAWHNLQLSQAPDGGLDARPEPASRHVGVPVEAGEKVILSLFTYSSLEALQGARTGSRAGDAARASVRRVNGPMPKGLRGFGRCLAIVDDGVPAETVTLLEGACDSRGVTLVRVDPRSFDYAPERALRDGDMLYRPAVSLQAMRVEQQLWHPRVGTFYRDPGGPLFSNVNANLTFARAGLPVPRTYWIHSGDRALIKRWVDELGGLPVVIKALGHSRGVGVIRADSLPSLYGIVDYALAEGTKPLLTSYIPDAVHWRVVVVGDRGVSSYRNVTDEDDFRTSGSSQREDYLAAPPPGAEALAVAACHALRHDHGGVDILEGPGGRLYLLEANFPCYYATAQLEIGTDVAGAMVEHLLGRAEALAPAPSAPFPTLTR